MTPGLTRKSNFLGERSRRFSSNPRAPSSIPTRSNCLRTTICNSIMFYYLIYFSKFYFLRKFRVLYSILGGLFFESWIACFIGFHSDYRHYRNQIRPITGFTVRVSMYYITIGGPWMLHELWPKKIVKSVYILYKSQFEVCKCLDNILSVYVYMWHRSFTFKGKHNDIHVT